MVGGGVGLGGVGWVGVGVAGQGGGTWFGDSDIATVMGQPAWPHRRVCTIATSRHSRSWLVIKRTAKQTVKGDGGCRVWSAGIGGTTPVLIHGAIGAKEDGGWSRGIVGLEANECMRVHFVHLHLSLL